MNLYFDIGDGKPRKLEAVSGATLLETLRNHEIFSVEAPCGGNGICGKCSVEILKDGKWVKALACQVHAEEGLLCRLPVRTSQDQLQMQYARTDIIGNVELDPDVALNDDSPAYGAAVDIGTTTLAAALYNLRTGERLSFSGAPNRQRIYGADVISRIQACARDGLERLTSTLRKQIDSLISDCCRESGVKQSEVRYLVFSGNTVMQHFFAGLSPESIGAAPFEPLSRFGARYPAEQLQTVAASGAYAYITPAVSGYVGGDITAGLLSVNLSRAFLFLDLGTNGEIALGCNGRIYCCAAAAGPAFEGAEITAGMSGTAGAVDHVFLKPGGKIGFTVIGGGKPCGICGSGLVDLLAVLLNLGIVDETGRMLPPGELPRYQADGLEWQGNQVVFRLTEKAFVTAEDIRKLQLAKAAVRAGIHVLAEHAGIRLEELETVYLAGGFGNYISCESAARIGLLPQLPLHSVRQLGNASLSGASRVLLSKAEKARVEKIAEVCEYVELSSDPGFSMAFMDAMSFEEESE